MPRLVRYILLGLLLIVVALASALTAMRIAIHGREVVSPKFVGLTPAEAQRLANDNGFLVVLENRFFSPDVPEGRIMWQSLPPGAKVRRGWRIRLAESLGPQLVTIPDVTGQSPRAAEINLRRRGLELGTVAVVHLPDVPPDQVVSQTPMANASGVSSPRVSVLVTPPPEPQAFVMPNLVGKTLTEATQTILRNGLKLGFIRSDGGGSTTPPPAGPAIVLSQSPAPGQKILAGAVVEFQASR